MTTNKSSSNLKDPPEEKQEYLATDESGSESESGEASDTQYEVEYLLNKQVIGNKMEYLIKWKGYDESFNTWEPQDLLSCPRKKGLFEHLYGMVYNYSFEDLFGDGSKPFTPEKVSPIKANDSGIGVTDMEMSESDEEYEDVYEQLIEQLIDDAKGEGMSDEESGQSDDQSDEQLDEESDEESRQEAVNGNMSDEEFEKLDGILDEEEVDEDSSDKEFYDLNDYSDDEADDEGSAVEEFVDFNEEANEESADEDVLDNSLSDYVDEEIEGQAEEHSKESDGLELQKPSEDFKYCRRLGVRPEVGNFGIGTYRSGHFLFLRRQLFHAFLILIWSLRMGTNRISIQLKWSKSPTKSKNQVNMIPTKNSKNRPLMTRYPPTMRAMSPTSSVGQKRSLILSHLTKNRAEEQPMVLSRGIDENKSLSEKSY